MVFLFGKVEKVEGDDGFFVDFSGQKKKINVKCFKDVRRKMLKSSQIEIYALERNSDQKSS